MNKMIRPPVNGSSGSLVWCERTSGDPRTDALLQQFKLADESERPEIARACATRFGEACAEFPRYLPCHRYDVMAILTVDLREDQAEELEAICAAAERKRAAEIDRASVTDTLDRFSRSVCCGGHREIEDFAEELGRATANVPIREIAAGLVAAGRTAGMKPTQGPFSDTSTAAAAERGRQSRESDIKWAHFWGLEALNDRDEAGTPVEWYAIDTDKWSPSPSEYYGQIAEHEAESRSAADARVVEDALKRIRFDALDFRSVLEITRIAARQTLASSIGVIDLRDEVCDAGGIAWSEEEAPLRYEVELSIEVARENRDEPYDDDLAEKRVATIMAWDAGLAPHPDSSLDITEAAPSVGQAEQREPALPPDFDFAGPLPVRAPTDAEFEAVTHLPGKVGELIDFIDNSSEEDGGRPLALAATLAFVGALSGRLYASPSGLRTNVYTIGLAPSGVGKEHARRCIKSLVAQGNLTNFISAGMASGTGLRNKIEAQGSVVYLVDEFHVTMSEWNNPRLPHAAQTKKNVLEYFSAADNAFYGIDYAGNSGQACHNPNLCIYGTSTPAKFIPACSAGSAEEGLLPRMLTFSIRGESGGDDRVPTADASRPPRRLVELCRDLTIPKVGGNLMNARARDTSQSFPAVVARYGPGAEDAYRERKRKYKNLAKAAPADREPFLRRVNEHATKIALILAIGVDADQPVITLQLLDHGHRIAELCTASMLSQIDGRLADNDRQREYLDVKRWIVEAGWAGVTRKHLATRVNGRFDDRRLDDILKSLTETTCEVVTARRPVPGRPVLRYVAVVNLKPEEKEGGA